MCDKDIISSKLQLTDPTQTVHFKNAYTLLIYPVLLHCKGEVVHFLLLSQGYIMVEAWPSDVVHTEVGDSVGSLDGRVEVSALRRVG